MSARCEDGGGPGEPRRSRKERRDELLEGVPSGMGDADPWRDSGLRRVGSLDAVEGVKADVERAKLGVVFA